MENNTFVDNLNTLANFHLTENGGLTHSSTEKAVYDLFALGGAYRQRSDEDCIFLFKKAYEEDPVLALKCLFYLRDIVCGQGERRFFRVCFKWLANNHPEAAARNMKFIPTFGRVDDLYCLDGTPLEKDMYKYLKELVDAGVRELNLLEREND